MTLWKKDGPAADGDIMAFTIGDDRELDYSLVPYDIIGSIAHAMGLEKTGVLTKTEVSEMRLVLSEIYAAWHEGLFSFAPDDEDSHSALERILVERLGDTGKKIHAGRSRNDQVLTALRLFMKKALLESMDSLCALALKSCEAGFNHLDAIMPGYTHGKRAMPSTVAFWYASFAEGFSDSLKTGKSLFDFLDSSPLGAAAGFGVPLPLNREYTANLMGFGRVQINAQAVQMSRGRIEAALIGWLFDASRDIEKMAGDLLLFSTAEYGFVKIPEEFCTGSSIMPQKKNADFLELLRAMPSTVRACRDEVEGIVAKLGSGYHRDFQLTKDPLFRAVRRSDSMLSIMKKVLPSIEWDRERLVGACSDEIFTTHRAMELVASGLPFRDAYAQSARELQSGTTDGWEKDAGKIIKNLSHTGAPGNPGLAEAKKDIEAAAEWIQKTESQLTSAWARLVSIGNL